MMKFNGKAFLQGAGFAAVAFVTALLTKYAPLVTVLFAVLPLYMAVLARRWGTAAAIVPAAVAGAATFAVFDAVSALSYALYLVAVGGVLAFVYKKDIRGFYKLAAIYVALVAVLIAMIAVYQGATGKSFSAQIVANAQKAFRQALTSAAFVDTASVNALMRQVKRAVGLMIPSVLLIVPAVWAWLLTLLSDVMLRQQGFKNENPLPPLSQWYMPRHMARFFLILLIVSFFGSFSAESNIYIETISNLTNFAYGVMGLSFLFWVFNRKRPRESTGVKVAILVVCAIFFSFMANVLPLIGIIDVYSRIRLHIIMRDKRR